jgi:hypothetical protein
VTGKQVVNPARVFQIGPNEKGRHILLSPLLTQENGMKEPRINVTSSRTSKQIKLMIKQIDLIEPVHPHDPSRKMVTRIKMLSNENHVVRETIREIVVKIYEAGLGSET